jgi:thiol:disulfide interchange protein
MSSFHRIAASTLLMIATLFTLPAFAQLGEAPKVRASLLSEFSAFEAGNPVRLGVLLKAEPGWHTYWKDPGDAGLPTQLKWTLPEGFSAGEIDWPTPMTFKEGDLTTYGYHGETLLPVTITPPAQLTSSSYTFKATATWLACKEICIPERQELSLELPVGTPQMHADSERFKAHVSHEDATKLPAADISSATLMLAIASALLGGLILNLMPCVLPVLSLKALSLVHKSGKTRGHTVLHGIAYSAGILLCFALLAAVLIFLQQAGNAVGWGYQMQSPVFVGVLVYLLFLVGLNLSGVFHLPVLLGNTGSGLASEPSVRGSFFTGILATAVATPCTAPFMASAVGVALTMPAWAAMLVFLSLGLGLALPFLLISIFPKLLAFLPKPGAWMERFKEFLAFPIYASVIWLLWVLGLQVGAGEMAGILAGLLFIVFLLWLGKHAKGGSNLLYGAFVLMTIAASLWMLHTPSSKLSSVPYSKVALEELRAAGKPVYIDATAAWCITCQLNARTALHTAKTEQAFRDAGVTLMVADWTLRDEQITKLLAQFGFNGVPLNVYYPPGDAQPVVLPQLLTESIIIDTIEGKR